MFLDIQTENQKCISGKSFKPTLGWWLLHSFQLWFEGAVICFYQNTLLILFIQSFLRIILTFFGLGWALAGMTRTIYIILHLSEHASSIPMFFSEKWNKPQFDAETFPNGKQKPSPVEHFHFYVQILLHFTFDLPKEFCSLYFTLFRGKYFSDFCALHFGIQC